MKRRRMELLGVTLCLTSFLTSSLFEKRAWGEMMLEPAPVVRVPALSPAAVGWGNLLVPGLGATLRGQPARGLLESSLTIGLYYGGTFYAKEGAFTVDGTVLVPTGTNITKPLLGQFLQEFGLKFHMWNTFYHYQQTALAPGQAESQGAYAQPLYRGDWQDVLFAPFKWKNLSTPWTYIPVALSTIFLLYSYNTAPIVKHNHSSKLGEELLYDFTQGVGVPLGSSFGEEAFFRGFMQRELRHYTNSVPLSLLLTTVVFTFAHEPELRVGAAAGGIFFGLTVNHFDGNLEPAIASHFWIDFISGVFVTMLYRKVQGKSVPLSTSFQIPF